MNYVVLRLDCMILVDHYRERKGTRPLFSSFLICRSSRLTIREDAADDIQDGTENLLFLFIRPHFE